MLKLIFVLIILVLFWNCISDNILIRGSDGTEYVFNRNSSIVSASCKEITQLESLDASEQEAVMDYLKTLESEEDFFEVFMFIHTKNGEVLTVKYNSMKWCNAYLRKFQSFSDSFLESLKK